MKERKEKNGACAVYSKLRLGAETSNGYKWIERPGSAVLGDQAEHRRLVGPGGKRRRAESECPVRLVCLPCVHCFLIPGRDCCCGPAAIIAELSLDVNVQMQQQQLFATIPDQSGSNVICNLDISLSFAEI